MRKILLFIGILLLGMGVSAYAATKLDAPHNQTNTFYCSDCHNYGSFPVDDACLSCHINDTGGGYSKNSAPKVLTHSSANTSTKYGTWAKLCKDCHQPHTQQQREANGSEPYLATGTITLQRTNFPSAGFTTYNYNNLTVNNPDWSDPAKWNHKSGNASGGNERGLILFPNLALMERSGEIVSATATTITIKGYPGAVAAGSTFAIMYGQHMSAGINQTPVKFYTNKGANSFAYDESGTGTDPTPNGICQVCHTQTTHWKSDGTLAGIGVHAGQNGANCVQCHKHEEGFKAAGCNTCHGFPPTVGNPPGPLGGPDGLVSTPAPTGSAIAGKHGTHVNTVGMDCAACHYNSKGSGPTHNDGTVQAITMGFYLFNGVLQGGAYNGQSGVDYNTTVTSPITTVSNTGAKQCSSIYCHSTGQGSNGGALAGGDYKTPAWDGTVVCGDCHRSDGSQGTATYMQSGSHLPHVNATINKHCNECHNGAGSGTTKHADNLIQISFAADPFGNTPSYSQSPNTPGNGYGSCSTVYCHSSAQANGGVAAGTYKTPVWDSGALGCTDCHANASMSTGSHTPHLAVFGVDCTNCHNNAGPFTDKHANRNIEVAFNGLTGGTGTYSQSPNPPGNGYGSCSTTWCHGTLSSTWGTDMSAVATCEKCHGSANTAQTSGTFKDTGGNTSGAKVGAHVSHLASTHNLSNDVACNQCHTVPGSVTAVGHIDSALPAELNGSVGYAGGTCSTVWCHGVPMPKGTTEGANRMPAWNAAGYLTGAASHDCAQCHGYPPLAIAAHTGMGPTTCINCHNHVNAEGTGFTNASLHVDGILQGGGDDCSNCHTDAGLSASHLKHSNPSAILSGKKLSLGDYGKAWFYSVNYVSGAPKFGCGYCHPNTEATHMNGVRNLNMDPNDAAAAGTVKAKNGYPSYTQTSGTSVTCSSVYCHSTGYDDGTGYVYQTTPNWYGGLFAGDKCSNCHGNSPNTGGKTGSLSHYNPDAMGMGVVGGHFVGIHYNNVYDKTNGGLIKDGSNRQNAHGTASTSTTINCNTCHQSTVTTNANDQNAICGACHSNKGSMAIAAASIAHINGTPDVAFEASVINSKAQIRDDITTVASLNNNWTRTGGYKAGASSKDASVQALNAVAVYDAGTKTCSSVACHNGISAQWGAMNITCNSCHTSLP